MADVKWIKIVTDVFDDEKVLLIESLPEADSIIVIWFKLLCLAGKQNNSGVFLMNDKIPYTDKMLSTIFRRKESTVQLALQTFKDFGMIEIVDGVITIPNWEKHQNLQKLEMAREQTRKRVAKHRAGQKLLASGVQEESQETEGKEECNEDVTRYNTVTVTQCNADRIDKNRIDKNKKKNIYIYYGEYQNVFFTEEQYQKLQSEFPNDYNERIDKLDLYIQSTGKKYKDCLATIRNWARKEKPIKKNPNASIDWNEWDKKNNSSSQLDSAEIDKLLQEGEIF